MFRCYHNSRVLFLRGGELELIFGFYEEEKSSMPRRKNEEDLQGD